VADFQADTAPVAAFARQLTEAGHRIADLEAPNTTAGRVVLEAARPAVPTATGQLSGSLTADAGANGVAWASTARYWTFVHWGAPRRNIRARPFFIQALEADRDRIVAVYADHIKDALRTIT
jgi:hypothetical protein